MGDITARAVQTLRDADFIAAEDTRVSGKLLERLAIKKPLISYYEHNLLENGAKILARLTSGENCALVTDAGTPAISDPGEDLVRSCADAGIAVTALPGPCAAVSALSLSGLPTGRFTFEGFLSTAGGSRAAHLEDLKTEKRTMIFYEAPHKLRRTLADMLTAFGERRVSISRELTKIYEETIRCTLSEAVARFEETEPRGEFVIIIEGFRDTGLRPADVDGAVSVANSLIGEGQSLKDAVKKAAEECGVPKNALYNAVVKAIHKKQEVV
jgi:16S rRNA (cytidine1402-2'-O)-methyltransferase